MWPEGNVLADGRKHGASPPRASQRLMLFRARLLGRGRRRVMIASQISFLENTLRTVHRNHFGQVNVAVQFGSQVFPPSLENDCSVRNEVGVTSENTNRTRTARP
jgi:hypothetical protein